MAPKGETVNKKARQLADAVLEHPDQQQVSTYKMSKYVFRPRDLSIDVILDYSSLIYPSRQYMITAIIDPSYGSHRLVNRETEWDDLVEMRSIDQTEYLRFTVKYVVTSAHFSLLDEALATSNSPNVVNFDERTANGTQPQRRTRKQATG